LDQPLHIGVGYDGGYVRGNEVLVMSDHEVFELFDALKPWVRGEEQAPHKPLLILYALGRFQRERVEWIPFKDVDHDLRALLIEFGPERQSIHPEYPFWRLQHDGIWHVESDGPLESRQSNTDPKKSELMAKNARGRLTEDVLMYLHSHSDGTMRIASRLLSAHFPVSRHDAILAAVALKTKSPQTPHRV
jgi:putative restriction endonuclease